MDGDLPKLSDNYLGPQAKFFPYGMSAMSHPDPVIRSDSNKIEIVIGMTELCRFTTKVLGVEPKGEMNQCVFAQLQDMEMHFLLAFPRTGFFKFQIYALPKGEAGPQMINVFNYVIQVKDIDTYVEAFPKQYPVWKQEGCVLYEPFMLMKGIKDPNVKFRFKIPRALDVQVKVHEDWNQLQKLDNNIYEGYIDFSKGYPPGSKVKLNVKTGRSHKFDVLLEYTI